MVFLPFEGYMKREYLDIVNEENKVIGIERRDIVHKMGLWHRGIHILLLTPKKEIILSIRSPSKDTYPNTLDCTVSEHLLPGETYKKAAYRGLKEEVGIEEQILRKLNRFKMRYGPSDNMISELYEGTASVHVLKIDKNEVSGIQLISLSLLKEMLKKNRYLFSKWTYEILKWYIGQNSEIKILSR